jgi:hypothetical protein
MTQRIALIALLAALAACSGPSAPANPSAALFTSWGVYPYEMRPDGLLINGLTPVDPDEHF